MLLLRCTLTAIVAAFALAQAPLCHALPVPPYEGFVTDRAKLLQPDERQALESTLQQAQSGSGREIAILTLSTLEGADIAQFALDVHRAWGLGSRQTNDGILLLLVYDGAQERKIWISTGYGAEGAVPDLLAKQITELMTPLLRQGAYGQALSLGVDRLLRALAGEPIPTQAEGEADVPALIFLSLFLGWNILRLFGSWFAQTKAWWMGGLVGLVVGAILAVFLTWWWTVPLVGALGLGFDALVSKVGVRSSRHGWRSSGYSSGGWGSGGGGFGGFGGGSSGGGGAGGSW
jgi:uncharacterized protein